MPPPVPARPSRHPPACHPRAARRGLGAAFGILAACGVRIPTPNSLEWEFAVRVNGLLQWADKTFGKQG